MYALVGTGRCPMQMLLVRTERNNRERKGTVHKVKVPNCEAVLTKNKNK